VVRKGANNQLKSWPTTIEGIVIASPSSVSFATVQRIRPMPLGPGEAIGPVLQVPGQGRRSREQRDQHRGGLHGDVDQLRLAEVGAVEEAAQPLAGGRRGRAAAGQQRVVVMDSQPGGQQPGHRHREHDRDAAKKAPVLAPGDPDHAPPPGRPRFDGGVPAGPGRRHGEEGHRSASAGPA
jgi:hypothetical protein